MPMQHHQQQQAQQPHRRARRGSASAGSVLAQLTRGLTLTYAQVQPASPPAPAPPPPSSKPSAKPAAKPSPPTSATPKHKAATPAAPTASTGENASATQRRMLTKKTRPSGNNGLDNEEQNLIVRARDVFGGRDALPVQPAFVVLDLLGQGTFGQVFRCQNTETKELVAIKVIRNHPSYYKQAIVEVQITRLLNASYSAEEAPHFVRLKDTFEFRNHLCIVFELLSINVYELIAENNFNGFPLEVTRGFQQQILHALVRMDEIGVIHCDLKPENILLVGQDRFLSDVEYKNDPHMARLLAASDASAPGGGSPTTPTTTTPATSARLATGRTPYIKVVDFGSACMENETVYSYIQSRFYRSPEVLLGIPYTGSIDMWSLGCIAVEMFLGLPLFPGVSEHDQLRLIEDTLGKLPQELLRKGRNVLKFYNVTSDNRFVLKTPAEFARDTQAEVQVSKKYFKYTKLEDMIHAYPYAKHATETQKRHERTRREAFLHFVRGLLCVDPLERWSARVAIRHPFITGSHFERTHVEATQRKVVVSPAPTQCRQPLPCVVAPHRVEYAPHVEHAWPSPVQHFASAFGELPVTPTYSDSIWGPSGMPPYAPGRAQLLHADQQLTPTEEGYYGSHYQQPQQHHQHHDHRPTYHHHKAPKVVPSSSSSHGEIPSSRVYPYDPYSDTARLQKAYEVSALQASYSPSSAYTPTGSNVTRSTASDGFPVVPLSPYELVQPDYDAPYYAPPHTSQVRASGDVEWSWGDARYEMATSSTGGAPGLVAGASYGHEAWQHEELPRHHQYMPEQAPPHRRGKRQHTNSWDSGDTRELRRHEAAHPQSGYVQPRQGYPQHLQHQQQRYAAPPAQQRGHGVSSRGSNASGGSRVHHSTPRKNDHKGRSGASSTRSHHRKSPKGPAVAGYGSAQQQQQYHQYQYQQSSATHHAYGQEFVSRDHVDAAGYPQYHHPQHYQSHASYASAGSKRDEATGVCSVEEKFSSVMSLDLPTSAVPLPT